jgi:hypothetical protein
MNRLVVAVRDYSDGAGDVVLIKKKSQAESSAQAASSYRRPE